MIAGKWFDPCVGVDIHIVLVPTPGGPVPTPLPHPFVGLIYDPAGLIVGAAISAGISVVTGTPFKGPVLVNSLPSAQTGTQTTNKMTMPHFPTPPGVAWAGKPPANDGFIVTGSKTVYFSGCNAVRLGDLVMTCGEPVRLPSSTIIAIPMGLPVLVGGPPTLDVTAALLASIRTQWVSAKLHSLLGAAEGSWLSKAICFFTGHPVDVASGMVMTCTVDLKLPGPIPFVFERTYYSRSERNGSLGYGWAHTYDQYIRVEPKRIVLHAGDGRDLYFSPIKVGETARNKSERLTLKRFEEKFVLQTHDGKTLHFVRQGRADGGFSLVRIENRAGDHLDLTYDQCGHLAQVIDSVGRRIRFVAKQSGRLTALEVPHPQRPQECFAVARFEYDDFGDLVCVRDALGNSQRYLYKNHLLVQETNRNGLSFHFAYDGVNNDAMCVRTWGDGGLYDHVLTYDKVQRITVVENSLGNKTTYFADRRGAVIRKVDPLGGVTVYEWDEFCRKRSETDADGRVTRFNYDELGNCREQILPDGARIQVLFDSENNPVEAVDRAGGIWKWKYSASGHLTSQVNPAGNLTTFSYENARLMAIKHAEGGQRKLGYDSDGNLISVRLDDGAEYVWNYDALGRVTGSKDPQGRWRRGRRDALGRLIEVEEVDGTIRYLRYDAEGNLTHYRDSDSEVTMTYTGLRSLRTFTRQNATVEYVRDTEGRLLGVKNQQGHFYRFELDQAGRVAATVGYDGSRTVYQRAPTGKTLQIDQPSGLSYKLGYDSTGRLASVTNSNGETITYQYRPDGALVEAAKKAVKITFERDVIGRIVKESQNEAWISSDYNREGYRVATSSSLGFVQRFSRNTRGYVDRMTFGYQRPTCEIKFKRDLMGRETERAFTGGIFGRKNYDVFGRVRAQEFGAAGRLSRSRSYEWAGDLRLCSVTDSTRGREEFGRDSAGKLAWARDATGSVDMRVQDEVGNCYASSDCAGRKYDRLGRLIHANGNTYRYDADGNLMRKTCFDGRVWNYVWDGWGMLAEVQLPSGESVHFNYDALGRRVSKTFRDRTTRWVWDGNVPIHEWTSRVQDGPSVGHQTPKVEADPSACSAVSRISWLFEPDQFSPIAKLNGDSPSALICDHLGTPIAMFEDSGETAWSAELDLWGKPRMVSGKDSACPFRWPGQYQDEETGLHYNRFRYYDPDAGIYISEDPIGLLGGLGMYAYSADVKASFDPFGLAPTVVIGENARRLKEVADALGYDWIGPAGAPGRWPRDLWPVTDANFGEAMEFNDKWIQQMMDEGREIVDIGRDPARVEAGEAISDFYAMELQKLADAGYPKEELDPSVIGLCR